MCSFMRILVYLLALVVVPAAILILGSKVTPYYPGILIAYVYVLWRWYRDD